MGRLDSGVLNSAGAAEVNSILDYFWQTFIISMTLKIIISYIKMISKKSCQQVAKAFSISALITEKCFLIQVC